MLWAHGQLYTFYEHLLEQLELRKIRIEWVEAAMLDPDEIEYSKSTGRYMYDKFIEDAKSSVRVVVDEEEFMIVTAHFLKGVKR
ncbi:MAG: DUF4258 domain-containing protein [Burkholderiales bacterium]|nr:DUF4258 domain-containing protein [Anaerolineae bacterium]